MGWRNRIVFAFLDEPPFCAPTTGGSAVGCDVELLRAMTTRLGIERVDMRLVTFSELLPGAARGDWTVTTPLFVTAERQAQVDFSRPVWSLADGLMIRRSSAAVIDSYEAIAADETLTLGVVSDQVQEETAKAAGVPQQRIVRFQTQRHVVDAVVAGVVDAYASVAAAHRGLLDRDEGGNLAVVDLGNTSSQEAGRTPAMGAFAFAKENTEFRIAFDRELRLVLGSSWHRAMMRGFGFTDADIDRALALQPEVIG